jgi:hypothetical protein
MAHEEFPSLTKQAERVLMHAKKGFDVFNPYWDRRLAAAVIREAVWQAGTFAVGTGLNGEVVEVVTLSCIADNLHALPPVPPTREELDQALLEIETWERFSEIRSTEWFKERFAVLRRGIAHHCKVQP